MRTPCRNYGLLSALGDRELLLELFEHLGVQVLLSLFSLEGMAVGSLLGQVVACLVAFVKLD